METPQYVVVETEVNPEFQMGSIWTRVTAFGSTAEAVAYIRERIREDWQQITMPEGVVSVADRPGLCYPPGSVAWSDVYYAEDGTVAWWREPDDSPFFRKLELKQLGGVNA